jgi:hypothetical protein
VTQPKARWQRLCVAIGERFSLPVEAAEWQDHGGWLKANISVIGKVSESTLRDITAFSEGFLAADGGKFD